MLQEWLVRCSNPEYILPPISGDHDLEFRWFSAEQSVLNQVIARRIEAGVTYPNLSSSLFAGPGTPHAEYPGRNRAQYRIRSIEVERADI